MSISKVTAEEIALAYREVEAAEELLAKVVDAIKRRATPDIRDAFGRRHDGLTLGVPQSDTSRTMFNVPWTLAKPIIEAHIAHHKARIDLLSEKAREELAS